nr:protease pro-enzyme activation domain-containing protein [Ktedonobacteraceae bacterium]
MKFRTVYPVVLVPLLGLIIIGTALWAYVSPFTHATPASGRLPVASTIAKFTNRSHVIGQANTDQQVTVSVGLSLRNEAELSAYIQQITTPGSPLYHHYLNAETFDALFAPLPSSEAAMVDYLRSQGLTVTATYPNHLMVDARGTVAQAEQAFQVHINDYQDALGVRFFANDAAPSLPTPLAAMVTSVTGLDNLAQYKRVPPADGRKKPALVTKKASNLAITCPTPGAATVPTSYTPSQIATAYDFNQLYGQGN